jgi:Rab GDP dissociation inhibitor
VALYTSDDFMNRPAVQVLEKLQTYIDSVGRFGESPFIYPVYGLAGIPESFSRKCAVYGGTFMLNVTIHGLDYDPSTQMTTLQGSFEDVKGIAKSKIVIGNPSYFVQLGMQKLVRPIGKILRCICIIDHQIPNTGKSNAVQIILP